MRDTSCLLLTLSLLILLCGCRRHQPQPISEVPATYLDLNGAELSSHIITSPPPLRLSQEEWNQLTGSACGGEEYIPYLLHISAQGLVEEATLQPYQSWCNTQKMPSDPPPYIQKHLAEAESLSREGRFQPWIINGHPAAVIFRTSIAIAPPEKYGPSRAFPKPVDPSSVIITMQMNGCEGRCPAYKVTIHGDGTVEYQGYAYVAVKGNQTAHIPPEAVSELLRQFDQANFFSALPKYIGAYDGGDVVLQLDVNHISHTVVDGSGMRVGLPTSIDKLERLIDQTANTHPWVFGT